MMKNILMSSRQRRQRRWANIKPTLFKCIELAGRYSAVRYGTVRYGTGQYGTVRYGMIRYGNMVHIYFSLLKGLAQAKIIKKSVILFCVLNMTI